MYTFKIFRWCFWFAPRGRLGQARHLNLFERIAYRRKYPNSTDAKKTGITSRTYFGVETQGIY